MTDSEKIAENIIKLLFKADRCGTVSPRDFANLIETVSIIAETSGKSVNLSKMVRTIATANGSSVATSYEDTFTFENGNQIEIKAIDKVITFSLVMAKYDSFKFIQKGFGGNNLTNHEVGDIFCGWSNDGTMRYSEAKWLGGDLANSDNFLPIVFTEI